MRRVERVLACRLGVVMLGAIWVASHLYCPVKHDELPTPPGTSPRAARLPGLATVQAPAVPAAPLAERPGIAARSDEAPPPVARAPSVDLAAFRDVIARDRPWLVEVGNISRQALSSARDLEVMRDRLSDPVLIQEAGSVLSRREEELNHIAQYERILTVDYLSTAVSWSDNPARDRVLQTLHDVLLNNDGLHGDSALVQSRAGDRMELYQALFVADRAVAEQLAKLAGGSKAGRVIEAAQQQIGFASVQEH
jgi:hypothetical protein